MGMYHQLEIAEKLLETVRAALPNFNVVTERDRIANVGQVLVVPVGLVQPESCGTSRTFQQTYSFSVRVGLNGGSDDILTQCDDAQKVFDAVMADKHLGETCWHAQVTNVEYREDETRLDVIALRSEVWTDAT